ncbi:hypothetical protein HanPSC8_Chr02g0073931 [Helianthus annuus]|nr:hypothetical protein HanPSC8_Chr02g0073931 [Helianthus annuus]
MERAHDQNMSYQALPLVYVNALGQNTFCTIYLVEWYCLDCGSKQGYTRFTNGSCPNFVKIIYQSCYFEVFKLLL